jgi:hypothetical protein
VSPACGVCHRDPRGFLAPSEDGTVVCKGCVLDIAERLEGSECKDPRPRYCVCGELAFTVIGSCWTCFTEVWNGAPGTPLPTRV